eukprot:scaffold18330_cov72-Phaeocystis_antarctica.AAC.3
MISNASTLRAMASRDGDVETAVMKTDTPPLRSGAGAARRVNLLIVVIPAQNAALGRQDGNESRWPLLTLPGRPCVAPTRAETNRAADVSNAQARCSASSARPTTAS